MRGEIHTISRVWTGVVVIAMMLSAVPRRPMAARYARLMVRKPWASSTTAKIHRLPKTVLTAPTVGKFGKRSKMLAGEEEMAEEKVASPSDAMA